MEDLDAFPAEARIALAPVDEEQGRLALWARIRFGRGMGHGGLLSFGDAFSYALARTCAAPLLFVGDDFSPPSAQKSMSISSSSICSGSRSESATQVCMSGQAMICLP